MLWSGQKKQTNILNHTFPYWKKLKKNSTNVSCPAYDEGVGEQQHCLSPLGPTWLHLDLSRRRRTSSTGDLTHWRFNIIIQSRSTRPAILNGVKIELSIMLIVCWTFTGIGTQKLSPRLIGRRAKGWLLKANCGYFLSWLSQDGTVCYMTMGRID